MTGNMDGWRESERLVMAELERLADEVRGLSKEVGGIRVSIGKLEVKSGAWGIVGGGLVYLLAKLTGRT